MIKVVPGMKVRVEDARSFKVQSFLTLSLCLLKYDGEITNESYAESLKRNEGKSVWLSADSIALSAHRMPEVPVVSAHYGDELWLDEGRSEERGIWIIQKPGRLNGDNCQLIRKER